MKPFFDANKENKQIKGDSMLFLFRRNPGKTSKKSLKKYIFPQKTKGIFEDYVLCLAH